MSAKPDAKMSQNSLHFFQCFMIHDVLAPPANARSQLSCKLHADSDLSSTSFPVFCMRVHGGVRYYTCMGLFKAVYART